MIEQHHLLNTVADLIDSKKIKTTITDLFTPINSENLRNCFFSSFDAVLIKLFLGTLGLKPHLCNKLSINLHKKVEDMKSWRISLYSEPIIERVLFGVC